MELFRDRLLGAAFCFVGGLLPLMKPKTVDLTGKVAIVTGSNSGVGYGLALQLAEMGASVFLACRNETRAAQAKTSMLEACPDAKIEAVSLDVSSFDSVKNFAKNWSHGQISILAHNAGISFPPTGKEFTENGFEFQYQVNFLSSFLLTGLLDTDKHLAEDARILFTSSIGSYAGTLPESFNLTRTHLKREAHFHGPVNIASYAQSKLMQVAFARALQAHLDRSDGNKRLVYSWEPGLVQSNLLQNIAETPYEPTMWLLSKLQPIVGLDVRQGSATGVYLVTSDSEEVIGNRGRYFDRMRPRTHPADAYSQDMLDRLCARWSADAEIAWPYDTTATT